MNKFEQLIEYVINDDEQKARELFHEIVVEKSRSIYEDLMAEEEVEESAEEVVDESEEVVDESEEVAEDLGGDQADDLIDDIETEEEGISMEAEDDAEEGDEGEEYASEEGEDLEDRVVDLEDKLDELMAEFEALMSGDEGGEDLEGEMDIEVGDEGEFGSEDETMDAEFETEGLEEGISLKAAPKPVTSEEGSVNKKGVVASNSGAKGAVAKPVSTDTTAETGRTAPTAKDLGATATQDAGKGAFKSAAPKATTTQASGVNTKSPY